jgi:hypothetical protein
MAIFLYTDYVVAASVVLCAGYAVAANTNTYNKRKVWVKGFANACYKGKKDITKDVTYPKNKKDV